MTDERRRYGGPVAKVMAGVLFEKVVQPAYGKVSSAKEREIRRKLACFIELGLIMLNKGAPVYRMKQELKPVAKVE